MDDYYRAWEIYQQIKAREQHLLNLLRYLIEAEGSGIKGKSNPNQP
ncbi:hypothetical protein [Cyclobacterium jeungdonense]|uniref:Uncharacterized protein n=1 Tax=Cyclobacterium jeungdonense TaxID=708087 RepID=A0ABT8C8K5_9BACT|nr:hypothetical protein [Cyclobacterium jeungdonense]MDN3689074.1 hypothetical protein [Cyclobacterium jeungdonense]